MLKFDPKFFEKEERCGFEISELMKRYWASQINALSEIDKVCQKNNIMYFADWGTLLGTIRHKGFIPWDDDMDICMLRDDFNHFLAIAEKELPKGYAVSSWKTSNEWDNNCIRVQNGLSIRFDPQYLKQNYGIPFLAGVDVFPIDAVPDDLKEREAYKNLVEIGHWLVAEKRKVESGEVNVNNEHITAMSLVNDFLGVNYDFSSTDLRTLLELRNNINSYYYDKDTKYLTAMPLFVMGQDYFLPRQMFDEVVMMPFENIMIPVVKAYDFYLTKKYGGDYMTPKMSAKSSHDYPLYNKEVVEVQKYLGLDSFGEAFEYILEKITPYWNGDQSNEALVVPEGFYQDEVREGFLVDSRMKRYWAAQIEVLEEIKRVCEKLGIHYSATLGTLLGAVRHKGFIPWDDDIDIAMLRDDWFRFMEEAPKELGEWFEVKNLYNDPTQDNCHARVINNRHMCFDQAFLDQFHMCPYSAGIDIFPIDYVPRDEEKKNEMVKMSNLIYRSAYALPENGPYTEEHICLVKQLIEACGIDIDWNNRLFHEMKKLLDVSFSQCSRDEADEATYMNILKDGREKCVPISYYEDLIEVPFEYTTVAIPKEYDIELRQLYGENYMTPMNVASGHDYPNYKEQELGLKEVLDQEFGTDLSYEQLQQIIDLKLFGE